MATDTDRIKSALASFVRTVLSPIDYLALYPAEVVKQSGQAVDLVPDDPRIPQLEAVPLNLGLPGVEVEIATGSRVLLGFAGGDPRKPRATVWESSSLTSMKITASSKVVVDCPDVRMGGDGAEALAIASKVASQLGTLQATFDAHTHTGVTSGTAVTGVPAPLLTPAWPGDVTSSTAKGNP